MFRLLLLGNPDSSNVLLGYVHVKSWPQAQLSCTIHWSLWGFHFLLLQRSRKRKMAFQETNRSSSSNQFFTSANVRRTLVSFDIFLPNSIQGSSSGKDASISGAHTDEEPVPRRSQIKVECPHLSIKVTSLYGTNYTQHHRQLLLYQWIQESFLSFLEVWGWLGYRSTGDVRT